jgi:DNA-binding transcriptional ArsR family regulator
MSIDTPRVRDYTASDRGLGVAVETSPVYELLLSMFVWGNKNQAEEYEISSTFFEQLETGASATLADELNSMVDCGEIWLSLIGLAQASGTTRSVSDFLGTVTDMDAVALRRVLINGACTRAGLTDEQAEAAATGDRDAVAMIVKDKYAGTAFKSLLEADATTARSQLIDIITGAQAVLEASISDSLPALRRDAAEKRSLAKSMEPQKLVETATNGVTFKMQPQVTGILLIPSKIIRPWTVIIEHEGMQIFAYSVSDEHLNADPDAPPTYLVDLYKALGDERRLRMLSILAEGDHGLMEIADRVGLAKSTAHHHLRILRTAGLVRVTVGHSKSYSLRRDRVPEAAHLLDAYLTTPAEASSASNADS